MTCTNQALMYVLKMNLKVKEELLEGRLVWLMEVLFGGEWEYARYAMAGAGALRCMVVDYVLFSELQVGHTSEWKIFR